MVLDRELEDHLSPGVGGLGVGAELCAFRDQLIALFMIANSSQRAARVRVRRGAERGVEANLQPTVDAAQVSGVAEGLPKQSSAVIRGASIEWTQTRGQCGLRVIGAHAHGMGEQLALGLQRPRLRPRLRERDLVRGAIPLCLQAPDHLLGLADLLPGRGIGSL